MTPGEDTITFDPDVFTGGDNSVIRLTQGELVVEDSLSIDGTSAIDVLITGDADADDVTISGSNITNVGASFVVIPGATSDLLDDNSRVLSFYGLSGNLTLTSLTITGGRTTGFSEDGGGIFFRSSGVLSLSNSTISGNSTTGPVSDGGGIYTQLGSVSLSNSTVSGNSTTGSAADGGGVGTDSGSVSLSNSTLSGNSSGGDGGGISHHCPTARFRSGAVLLSNSTITDNSASGVGGAISLDSRNNSGVENLTLFNSIVAGNTDDGTAPDVLAPGDVANDLVVENSLIGDTTGSGITPTTGTGNILNQAALLGPLSDNGGPTQTHALLAGSPAIDAGDDDLAVDAEGNPLATDQRGGASTRVFDDPTVAGSGVDIGSFERQTFGAALFVVNTAQDELDFSNGAVSLREAIAVANASAEEETITFDMSVFTGGGSSVIRLTQGELVVEDSLSIDGTSVGGVLITGDADDDDITVGDTNITDVSASFGGTAGDDDDLLDDNSRVVNFTGSSGNLTLTGLTITGGRATGSFDNGGGIRFNSGGVLSLSNSTVSGNSSGGDGGGIYTRTGDVSLSSSTVSGNSSDGNGGGVGLTIFEVMYPCRAAR